MRPLHYSQLFADSDCMENNFDVHSSMGLMIADQAPSNSLDPLELLIQLEEQLMEEHGHTFLTAIKAGIAAKSH